MNGSIGKHSRSGGSILSGFSGVTNVEEYVRELETSEAALPLVLKNVYGDSNEMSRLITTLEDRIKRHNNEIQNICLDKYKQVEKVSKELMNLEENVKNACSECEALNIEIKNSVQEMSSKSKQLADIKISQSNTLDIMEAIEMIIPAFELLEKLKEQILNHELHKAVKTLNDIESTHLPSLPDTPFKDQLKVELPKCADQIKSSAMNRLKDFLGKIKDQSEIVGKRAMYQAGVAKNFENARENTMGTNIPDGVEVNRDPLEDIDFSGLFKCMYIFNLLKKVDNFVVVYNEGRKEQLEGILSQYLLVNDKNKSNRIISHLNSIAGFFIIEEYIMSSCKELQNQSYIDRLWDDKTVSMLKRFISRSVQMENFLDTLRLWVKFNSSVRIFCVTLEGYRYKTKQILDALAENKQPFIAALESASSQEMLASFDMYDRLMCPDQATYSAMIEMTPYHNPDFEKKPFPKLFPFSMLYTSFWRGIKSYIHHAQQFLLLELTSTSDLETQLKRWCQTFLKNNIVPALSKKISSTENVGQAVQCAVNMNCLQNLVEKELPSLISDLVGKTLTHDYDELADSAKKRLARNAAATKNFTDDFQQVVKYSFTVMNTKIQEDIKVRIDLARDEVLRLSSKNNHIVDEGQKSSYIMQFIDYLGIDDMDDVSQQDNLVGLLELPPSVALAAYKNICREFNKQMITMLCQPDVKLITLQAYDQLNYDLVHLQLTLGRSPILVSRMSKLNLSASKQESYFEETFDVIDKYLNLLSGADKEWKKFVDEYPHSGHASGNNSSGSSHETFNLVTLFTLVDKSYSRKLTGLSDRDKFMKKCASQLKDLINHTVAQPPPKVSTTTTTPSDSASLASGHSQSASTLAPPGEGTAGSPLARTGSGIFNKFRHGSFRKDA